MKFAIVGEHREFFRQNKAIEFEQLLSSQQVEELLHGIEEALAQRLKTPANRLAKISQEKLWKEGRDLWRDHPAIRKYATQNRLAEIASELMDFKPVRLGYDQYFSTTLRSANYEFAKNDSWHQWLQSRPTLKEMSSLQGVVGGVFLCLKAPNLQLESPSSAPSLFASSPGNGVFFHADLPIDLSFFEKVSGGKYLLITYAMSTSVYYLNESDPQAHALKRWGYVFGDRLSDKLNPILFR